MILICLKLINGIMLDTICYTIVSLVNQRALFETVKRPESA